MSKKRKTAKSTTPNVNKVIVEIDYDKLAAAIQAAQENTSKKSEDIPQNQKEKVGFFKATLWILQNKKYTHDRMTMGVMVIPVIALFKIIAILGFITTLIGLVIGVMYGCSMVWVGTSSINNICILFYIAVLIFIVFLYSIIMWGAANEMEKTNDKHFVAAVFSGMVSLVALIVSLIALKG